MRWAFSFLCCPSYTIGTDFNCKQWLVLDGCGLVCTLLALFLHIFSYHVALNDLLSPDVWGGMDKRTGLPLPPPLTSTLSRLLFLSLLTLSFLFALIGHLRALLTDPGAVPALARPLSPALQSQCHHLETPMPNATAAKEKAKALHTRLCGKCVEHYKPPRSHHCSISSRCITKLDHFCPWVCNSVGLFNHKFFFIFVFYTAAQCVLVFFLFTRLVLKCGTKLQKDFDSTATATDDDWQDDPSLSMRPTYCSLHLTGSVYAVGVNAVLFFLFTACMLFDQLDAITRNMSKIDRLKGEKEGGEGVEGEPLPSQITCSEIFGGSDIYPHLHWFLPIKAEFPTEQLPLILGYAVGGGGDVEMGGVEGDGGGGGCEGGECEDTGDVGEESGLLNETGSGSGARSRPVKSDRSVNEDEANIV